MFNVTERSANVDSQPFALSVPRRSNVVSKVADSILGNQTDEIRQKHTQVESNAKGTNPFRIKVVNDRCSREKALRLAARIYRQRGYMAPKGSATLFSKYDERPDTLMLLVEDQAGRSAATVTLVFDSEVGLPSDSIFHDEIEPLRQGGRRLAEVTRLVIAPEYQHSKVLLVRMFNLIYIYAVRVKKFSDFVVEVNPHHAGFYTRFLKFEQAGTVRCCPRVQSAPAALLRLDLSVCMRELVAHADPIGQPNRKLLYARFLPMEKEPEVASFMEHQQRPMSSEDVSYFKSLNANGKISKCEANEEERSFS